MSEETTTVQNGQSGGTGDAEYAVSRSPLKEAICMTQAGCAPVKTMVTSDGQIFALTVRGPKLDDLGQNDPPEQEAVMLLRLQDLAKLVGAMTSAATRTKLAVPFAAMLGAAVERERANPTPDCDLVPADLAVDMLAGRVPMQPAGSGADE